MSQQQIQQLFDDAVDCAWMQKACEVTSLGISRGQTPFGCAIVKTPQAPDWGSAMELVNLLACEHNVVWLTGDPTMHAEVHTIRQACETLGSLDLSGYTLYTTCEPCPMCLSASHWARIDRVVYGASIDDAKEMGFNELEIDAHTMVAMGKSKMVVSMIQSASMRQQCRELFNEFRKHGGVQKLY